MGTLSNLLAKRAGEAFYFDANCFIYLVEGVERYRPVLEPLMDSVSSGRIVGVTAEITLAEVLVRPLREGLAHQVLIYQQLLTDRQPFVLSAVNRSTWEDAARLRATTGLRLPDAVHLAAARLAGCTVFVSNDSGISTPEGIEILNLGRALADA